MSGHTPAPWSVALVAGRYAAYELQPASTRARKRALGHDDSGAGDKAELQANARLIAAAPDLLLIARRIKDAGGVWPDLARDLDAAIAKATGSTE